MHTAHTCECVWHRHACIRRNIVINKHTCRGMYVCVCEKQRPSFACTRTIKRRDSDGIAEKRRRYLAKSVLPLPLRNQSKIIHLHLEIFNMILFSFVLFYSVFFLSFLLARIRIRIRWWVGCCCRCHFRFFPFSIPSCLFNSLLLVAVVIATTTIFFAFAPIFIFLSLFCSSFCF